VLVSTADRILAVTSSNGIDPKSPTNLCSEREEESERASEREEEREIVCERERKREGGGRRERGRERARERA